jgi:hypothetical protein
MKSPRACGGCTTCCTLLPVEALEKPPGVRCAHACAGKGCAIYAQRPGDCRGFACTWLLDRSWPGTLRPDRCGFVVERTPDRTVVLIAARNDLDRHQRQLLMRTAERLGRAAIVSVAFRLNAPLPPLHEMMEQLPRLRCCILFAGSGEPCNVAFMWFYPVELHRQLFQGLPEERVREMLEQMVHQAMPQLFAVYHANEMAAGAVDAGGD